MQIKVSKCVIIPLGQPYSEQVVSKIREYPAAQIPAWSNIDIKDFGTHMGFDIRPCAGPYIWSKPSRKWFKRTMQVANAQLAPSAGISRYNE